MEALQRQWRAKTKRAAPGDTPSERKKKKKGVRPLPPTPPPSPPPLPARDGENTTSTASTVLSTAVEVGSPGRLVATSAQSTGSSSDSTPRPPVPKLVLAPPTGRSRLAGASSRATASGRLEMGTEPTVTRPACPAHRRHGIRFVVRLAYWKERASWVYVCGAGRDIDFCGHVWSEDARHPRCSTCGHASSLDLQKHGDTWGFWCHRCEDFGQ